MIPRLAAPGMAYGRFDDEQSFVYLGVSYLSIALAKVFHMALWSNSALTELVSVI